jgi:hypothetical protein
MLFDFKTGTLSHSATLPVERHQPVDGCKDQKPPDGKRCIAANKRNVCARQSQRSLEKPNRVRGSAQHKGNQAGGEQHQASCGQRQKAVREKVAMAHGTPSIFD